MTGTEQGWYPDPGGQADLRWWDGRSWTAHTRERPPEPPMASAAAVSASAAPAVGATGTTPLLAPSPTAPGSFVDWGEGAAPTSALVPGPAPTASTTSMTSTRPQPKRSWTGWAAVAAAVAVVIAVIAFLAASLLGTNDTHSNTGLGGAGGLHSTAASSTTSAATNPKSRSGAKTPTSTAPATSTPSPGSAPGSTKGTTFTDPAGVYTMSIDPGWVAGSTANGQVWTIPGPSPDQPWATVDVTEHTLGAPTSLNDFTQLQLALLAQFPNFTPSGNTTTTLADGSAATVLTYTSQLVPGQSLDSTVTVTVKGLHAVVVTLTTLASAPTSIAPSAAVYVNSLHLK